MSRSRSQVKELRTDTCDRTGQASSELYASGDFAGFYVDKAMLMPKLMKSAYRDSSCLDCHTYLDLLLQRVTTAVMYYVYMDGWLNNRKQRFVKDSTQQEIKAKANPAAASRSATVRIASMDSACQSSY